MNIFGYPDQGVFKHPLVDFSFDLQEHLDGANLPDLTDMLAERDTLLDCTSLTRTICAPGSHKQIIVQNWDWRKSVANNPALASISTPGKPQIWMVIEPGIVGKIRFNSASVGVPCLNAVRARPISTSLLLIHLLLWIALECESVDAAITTIESIGGAASSQHILITDQNGSRGLEVSPRRECYLQIHTNHFLENKLADKPPWLSESSVRLERVKEICGELLRARFFSDTTNTPQVIRSSPDSSRAAKIQTLFNTAVFGKPGSENLSYILYMPWRARRRSWHRLCWVW
ncbi:hypothetical protein C2E23DRAFT_877236 [Lenzites betulinus]|nr:hypothetical protein C2E23DRAFT_877236 [Lenzites betulinus]